MGDLEGRPASIGELLRGRRLLVVSNREPYTHRRDTSGLRVDRPAGGLVTALDPVMREMGGTWIAWGDGSADHEVTDEDGRIHVPPDAPRYTLKRIALTRPEIEGYYHGYANQTLWPLCHMAMHHMRFAEQDWTMYRQVNRRFAEAVRREADRNTLVWIHDYHLALCPRELRREAPDLFLMHFWHIPWPAWDVFRICPQSAEIVDGLLANDLVAFQHPRHAHHFLECAERELGARAADGAVEYDGRTIRVETLPISVDVPALDRTARSSECERWIDCLRRTLEVEGRALVVSVDRLDYTKGILERLQAIELFLRRRPEYRSRVVFVQKTAPSRTEIKAYRELQAQVTDAVRRLNAAFGTGAWQPVVHLPEPLPPEGMSALYRMADVCIVNSLQDGMNLVAKEFVACQTDGRGVLVLSDLAGACDELVWGVPVNPYDVEGCAAALARALEMPAEERSRRMSHLRAYVAAHDIVDWMRRHFEIAAHLQAERAPARWLFDAAGDIRAMVGNGRRRDAHAPLAVLADFDGTLARFADVPNLVDIPPAVRATLERLVRTPGVLVAIVSGRALTDLRLRAGIDGVVYAGNHGLEIMGPGWSWVHPEAKKAAGAIEECCARLRLRLQQVPGAWVEDKGLTASIHYRRTPHAEVERVRAAILEEAARLPAGTAIVRQGKDTLELRPDVAWDKGSAARHIVARFGRRPGRVCTIYIGDDETDEDAFRALADTAVTVKVGPRAQPTAARYRVRGTDEVQQFLRMVEAWVTTVPASVSPAPARGAAAGG